MVTSTAVPPAVVPLPVSPLVVLLVAPPWDVVAVFPVDAAPPAPVVLTPALVELAVEGVPPAGSPLVATVPVVVDVVVPTVLGAPVVGVAAASELAASPPPVQAVVPSA
ncbi:MAG TPA: hypothetical protein VFU02_07420 [Polyangiaceae bacterium]|nr:hypothetical protein [Polyangiaceae bacterium]